MKLEGKRDVGAKADGRWDPAGDVGMTECQGNPASTPKVSPTYRPTAKRWQRVAGGVVAMQGLEEVQDGLCGPCVQE